MLSTSLCTRTRRRRRRSKPRRHMAFDAERVRATWLPYSRVIDLSPFVFVSNTTQHMLDLIVAVLCRIVSLSIRGCLSIYPSICLSITLHARIIIITTCAQPFTYARVFLRGFVLLSTSCTAQEGLDRASHAPRSYVSVNQVAPRRCNSIDRAAVLQNCDDDDDERYTAASASNSSMMISNGIWYNNDAGSRV